MSKKTVTIPKPMYYCEGLPAGHANLEVLTPPYLPVAQYLEIMTLLISALHYTYEAFRTVSSPDELWPPRRVYGRFERDEQGRIRFQTVKPHIIGGAMNIADEGDEDQTLRISNWHYGSPTLLGFSGIGEILDKAGEAIVYVDERKHAKRMQKYEERNAELDLRLKELEVWEKYHDLIVKARGSGMLEQSSQIQLLPPPPLALEALTEEIDLDLEE